MRSIASAFACLLAMSSIVACGPVEIERAAVSRAAVLEADRIVTTDGFALPLKVTPAADGAPLRAVIVALHGFGDYRAGFDAPAAAWAKAGIATWAYDQRGFGETSGRGRWHGVDAMVDDALLALRLVAARHPGVPVYLAGESMGGAVALAAMGALAGRGEEGLLAGAILIAPAVRSRDTIGALGRAGLWLTAHALPWHPLGPTSIDFEPSSDKEMLRRFSADPKVLKGPRTDMIWGLANLMDRAKQAAPKVGTPWLMLLGRNDRLVPQGPTRALLDVLARPAGSALAVYPRGYHMLLRDLDASVPIADAVAWIADKRTPLPSGMGQADQR